MNDDLMTLTVEISLIPSEHDETVLLPVGE